MKLLVMILLLPIVLTANICGIISALFVVGATNGYAVAMELMEKAQDK